MTSWRCRTRNICGIGPGCSGCVRRWGRILGLGCAVLGVLLGCARVAHAQGLGVTAINVRQYQAGAPAPISGVFAIPVASISCNQAALPSGPVHSIVWDDPINAGQVCLYVDPGTGPLFAKVYGALELTITNVAGTLESPESNRAPFSHPPVAATLRKVTP